MSFYRLPGKVIALLFLTFPCLHIAASDVLPVQTISRVSYDEELHLCRLQDSFWAYYLEQFPETAAFIGVKTDSFGWTDVSKEAVEKRKAAWKAFLSRLHGIDREALPAEKKLQYDIFEWQLQMEVDGLDQPLQYLALSQLDGVHQMVPMVLKMGPGDHPQAIERQFTLMMGVGSLVDQYIELLKQGIRSQFVPPRILVEKVPEQIEALIAISPEKSDFFVPFLDKDLALQQRAKEVIVQVIYPAFLKFLDFVKNEYIPAARNSFGLVHLPGGKEAYAHLIKGHTTTTLTASQIHEMGLKEVERIQKELNELAVNAGFKEGVDEFYNHLNTNPDFFYTDKDPLLAGYREILDDVLLKLPALFHHMPLIGCDVVAVPEYIEKNAPFAYYMQSSLEAGRPGEFFVNCHDLKSHPKWMMPALALHEALPGHHYHLTRTQLADVPDFQKYSFTTAFVEGWGLYSEGLGKQLGIYRDSATYFGRLAAELLRAARLVVDTGIHGFGWEREQALSYFQNNLFLDQSEMEREIDRYIAMPGQALAYKIGELRILEWRAEAERLLGEDFDIRDFHEDLMGLGGYLPLEVYKR